MKSQSVGDLVISGFDADTAAETEAMIDRLEGDHPDSILFIAACAGDRVEGATVATVCRVEPDGLEIDLRSGGDLVERRRYPFDQAVATLAEIQSQLYALLHKARAAVPDHPATSIETQLSSTADLETYLAEVVATSSLGASFIGVTLRTDVVLPDLGGDEFWYVLAPRPGAEATIAPGFTMDDRLSGPEDEQPFGAYYTTRGRRDEQRELDLWVALHDHPDGVGAWARTATPGARVALWGPRVGYVPQTDAAGHLLVCDETGLAACASIIDQLPEHQSVTLVAEVIAPGHAPRLPERDRLEVVWVYRGDDAPGTGHRLAAAVEALDLDVDGLVAFGAAESREISAVRRHLRNERGMSRGTVHMTGYWRRTA